MILFLLQSPVQFKEYLSIENVTIYGVLVLVIAGLIWHIRNLDKKHEEEKKIMREEIKQAQEKLDAEYKRGTAEVGRIAENYHSFTTKVLERLNVVLNGFK